MSRHATVVGLGLLGGSLGLALRAEGWTVAGLDLNPDRLDQALALGCIDGPAPEHADPAEVTFVATPVGAVAAEARAALARSSGFVTDVGSVKAPIVAAVGDGRFVGGHPMAGSEQEGLSGADATMFEGAVWVLTPVAETDDRAFAEVRAVVASLGAEVVTIPPASHDRLVAVVSHVPHLTAGALMHLATDRAEEHRALLRLAAGGFRDMTRIAAGHPGIWPDICGQNRDAIVEVLDQLLADLTEIRDVVARDDRGALLALLEVARRSRRNLPGTIERPEELSEVRVPMPDRPGELARITALAAEIGVNIHDLEVAHSSEGDRGVLIMIVDKVLGERLVGALMAHAYRPSLQDLE